MPTLATRKDAEHKRMFPGYTTDELRSAAKNTTKNSPEQIALLEREISARESGISKPKKTPQAKWDSLKTDRKDSGLSKLDAAIAACDSVMERKDASRYNRDGGYTSKKLWKITYADPDGSQRSGTYDRQGMAQDVFQQLVNRGKKNVKLRDPDDRVIMTDSEMNQTKRSDSYVSDAKSLDDLKKQLLAAVSDVRKREIKMKMSRIEDRLSRGDADFNEGDHPRAGDGKFGSGGGSSPRGKTSERHEKHVAGYEKQRQAAKKSGNSADLVKYSKLVSEHAGYAREAKSRGDSTSRLDSVIEKAQAMSRRVELRSDADQNEYAIGWEAGQYFQKITNPAGLRVKASSVAEAKTKAIAELKADGYKNINVYAVSLRDSK